MTAIRQHLARDVVTAVAATLFPERPVVDLVPLRGGLESAVARVTLRDAAQRRQHIVVKRLASDARREAARYRSLAALGLMPSFLGAVEHGGATYLFLERIRPVSTWPWRDSSNIRLVLEQLARIHAAGNDVEPADDWNYEAALLTSAGDTVGTAVDSASHLPELDLRRELRALRRVAGNLADARERVRRAFGTTLIHGDVHTGNVILRRRGGRDEIVLLDWARSRAGSPLEDVSSWLLSLRSWEPAAAREHDTLLRAYLGAAGRPPALTPELREAYWISAASNALAGALRYHLVIARESRGRSRAIAIEQARAALRVIRRAGERLSRV